MKKEDSCVSTKEEGNVCEYEGRRTGESMKEEGLMYEYDRNEGRCESRKEEGQKRAYAGIWRGVQV
jgi:hypothetical protein